LLRRWAAQYSPAAKVPLSQIPAEQKQAALVYVSTEMEAAASTPAQSSATFIEIIFQAVTVRVHGAADSDLLKTVLDCLGRRT
jgi:hypothetical protein